MQIFIGIDKTLYPDLIWKYLAFWRKRAYMYIKLIDCLISWNILHYASCGVTCLVLHKYYQILYFKIICNNRGRKVDS